jgi:hypothetical protein
MNVRDDMLIALIKEILGPRDGFQEVLPLDQDPYSEYILDFCTLTTDTPNGLSGALPAPSA